MPLIDCYRRWFEYEKDSHAKVLASLDAVPIQLRANSSYQKAVDLMAHIVAARRLWLFRLGVTNEGPSTIFHDGATLADVSRDLLEMQSIWEGYLRRLTNDDLATTFEYHSLDGPRYRNTIEDILTQLFGHSWYHRGQIAMLVRSIGAEPAATDFVFWTRESIPE